MQLLTQVMQAQADVRKAVTRMYVVESVFKGTSCYVLGIITTVEEFSEVGTKMQNHVPFLFSCQLLRIM